ncbi:hypothetical protein Noda2021_05800 [Candidatus Dependentiae bacterium Noda2021]|nr:hypothetical protein Noda2021_05800 [Candidatus Dependentiae bacterium Noda2021]
MNKKLLIILVFLSTPIIAMEKEEPTFPWEQLLPELKNEIVKQVVNAPSILQAINYLQRVRFVNKELYAQLTNNKTAIFDILNTILKKFPNSEVAIARALNIHLAEEWLKKVNPNANFKKLPFDRDLSNLAEEYVKKGNLTVLKQLLDKGFDPKQQTFYGIPFDQYVVEICMSLPLLKLLSQYDSNILSQNNIYSLLWLVNKNKENTAPVVNENNEELISYLEQQLQQQIGQEEADAIISDIVERVKKTMKRLRSFPTGYF